MSCRIEFESEPVHHKDILKSAGECWRGMFGNPAIVTGFPIPRQACSDDDTGLEIPLDMIAALTSCCQVVNFAGMTYLKGFAAMLAAVGNVVFWHLCYNADGEYISYEDRRVTRTYEHHSLSIDALEGSRHIVGWTDNVRNFVGMLP